MKGRFPNLWARVAAIAIVLAGVVWAAVGQLNAPDWVKAICAAVAAGAGGSGTLLIDRIKNSKDRQTKLRDNLRFWQPPNARLFSTNEIDPFKLRITPSQLAQAAAGQGAAPPYVPRDQDAELDRALGSKTFVLVIGESKAGKSRSAFEAARRVHPSCHLVVPERRDSLQIVMALDPPLDLRNSVVWLDDLEGYLGSDNEGLTVKLLEACEAQQVHVLATMRTTEFEKYAPDQRVARSIREVLDRAETIRLETILSAKELDAAQQQYPRADQHFLPGLRQYGLGAYLLAGPELIRRLENQRGEAGSSIVLAAIDWRRAGLTRSITEAMLTKLYPCYLRQGREATVETFTNGLKWARDEIYPLVALLFLDGQGPPPTFKAFDYIVDHVTRLAPPVPRASWDLVLESARPEEGFEIGVSAAALEQSDVAERAFIRAAESGIRDAANNLGVVLEERGETRGAEAWYRKAAELGDVFAAYNLAVILDERGDVPEAQKWYRLAADAGDPDAQNNLANILDDQGQHAEAEALYRQAAASGLNLAVHNLGELFEARGDRAEAEKWYRQAALSGEADEAVAVGKVLEEKGDPNAERWFRQAAEKGDRDGAYRLAGILEEGGDIDGASAWYQKAADAGLLDAMNDLALLLDTKGDVVGEEAWLKKAAAGGQAEAHYNLGVLFEDRHEPAEAERWYRQAAELGMDDAKDRLAALTR